MSRHDDEQRAWRVQQAQNAEHQRLQKLEHDATVETYGKAKANGYSNHDAAILSNAVGKLARRIGGAR